MNDRCATVFLSLLIVAAPVASASTFADANLVAGELRVLDDDGGWCWFEGERAIVRGGQLLVGTVSTGTFDPDRRGDINVLLHNIDGNTTVVSEVHDQLECDDHDSPALLVRPDGRLLAVYSKHGTDDVMRWRLSRDSQDYSQWESPQSQGGFSPRYGATYSNVYRLAGATPPLTVNFFRGPGWDPHFVTSSDDGETWSHEPRPLLDGPDRPYLRYTSDGVGTVHFACTEQHPRVADTGIRYGSVSAAQIRQGTAVQAVEELTVVRAGRPNAVAWCSDIRLGRDGHPVIAYSVQMDSEGLPQGRGGSDCRYGWARFDGKEWHDHLIANAGTRLYAGEDDYTGLITLDPRDPSTVYFSTNADPTTGEPLVSVATGEPQYELYRGRTLDGGGTWDFDEITFNSTPNNIRPIVAAHENGDAILVWMRGTYRSYQDFDCAVVATPLPLATEPMDELTAVAEPVDSGARKPREIASTFDELPDAHAIEIVARAVANWQIEHESRHPKWDWTQAAYHVGAMHWALSTQDERIADAMRERFRAMKFTLGPRPFMADDHCVGYAYQQLALYDGQHADADALTATQFTMDAILARKQNESLAWTGGIWDREWAWCDALFMAPPTLAHMSVMTGDSKYLERADTLWWKTTDFLYNADEHLFFRDARFLDQKESNGRAVHWSRGNGWVVGGLVRMLEILPEDHPSRPRYVKLFTEMCAKLAELQTAGGSWTSSLLAPPPDPQPETSGTAFFCYAMAWGVNQGLLDETSYGPVIDTAWASLVRAVHPDGKLGWVQRAADAPGTAGPDETEVYAVGGFLLAAAEMWERSVRRDAAVIPMTFEYPAQYRPATADRSISIPWEDITDGRGAPDPSRLAVWDVRRGTFLRSKLLLGSDGTFERIVVDFVAMPGDTRAIEVCELSESSSVVAERVGDSDPSIVIRRTKRD